MNSIIVFPNSSVEVKGSELRSTEAILEFVTALSESYTVSVAAASEPPTPGSRHSSVLNGTTWLQLFSSKKARYQTTHFRQAVGYVTAVLRMLFCIPKKPIWYIFLPGHMGTLACLVCCLLGKRFGIYVRGEWPKSGVVGLLHRWYFKKATFIFSTGASFTNTLLQFNDHVEEVSPMMRFRVEDLREKLSYKADGRMRLLYVGAISPSKGVFEIVKAMTKIAMQHDVEVKLLGSGSLERVEALQSEIQASGCADKIELVGQVDNKQELAKWFTSADIFIFPTYNEGFPRVVYEAMGFGLPVISTDFEGGKLFLRNQENCLIVPKKNVERLTNALLKLFTDESLRTTIGKRAFLDSQALFSRFEGISHGSQVAETVLSLQKND